MSNNSNSNGKNIRSDIQNNKVAKIGRRIYKIFVYWMVFGVVFWWGLGAGIVNPVLGVFIWIAGFSIIIFRKRIYRQLTKYIRQGIAGVRAKWF